MCILFGVSFCWAAMLHLVLSIIHALLLVDAREVGRFRSLANALKVVMAASMSSCSPVILEPESIRQPGVAKHHPCVGIMMVVSLEEQFRLIA